MSRNIKAIKLLNNIKETIGQFMDGLLTEVEAVKLIREKVRNEVKKEYGKPSSLSKLLEEINSS